MLSLPFEFEQPTLLWGTNTKLVFLLFEFPTFVKLRLRMLLFFQYQTEPCKNKHND